MSYVQRLWRVELLGLVSLIVVALTASIFLTVYSIPIQNISPTVFWDILEGFLFICGFGFLPVVIYGAPIFAAYLSKSEFRLSYLMGFAALPGLIMLLFSNLAWPYLLPFGLGVAITMEIVARLWPETFGRDLA